MKKILRKKFFERSAVEVAEDLIGKYVVRKLGDEIIGQMIVETEAYEGFEDLASHASKKRSARNDIMFGEAGRLYIYFIYGMYDMLNIVTGPVGHPAAVLIRGTADVRGPGRLTRELSITRSLNTLKAEPESELWFEDRGELSSAEKSRIKKTARIGVGYAGPIWAKKEYRFVLEEERKDSKKDRNK